MRAPSRGCAGSPARQGTRAPRGEAETRWFRRASGDAPGPGSSQIPALGGGAGLKGRRPRRSGLRRQLLVDAERGLPPRGPAGSGAALARGNAQLGGERWDPKHHPLRSSAAREWPGVRGEGVGGWVAEPRLSIRRGGRGGGWTRAATPAEGWALSCLGGRSLGRCLPIHTPNTRGAGMETPFCTCLVVVGAGGGGRPLRGTRRGMCL